MPEYGFSLIHILAYRNQIYDSALIREYTVSENLYSGIFYEVESKNYTCEEADCFSEVS